MATVLELSESRPQERTPTGWYKYWQKELSAADKRLRRFRKQGNRVVDRYLDRRGGNDLPQDGLASPGNSLNLFHSNINTMQSMLYGNTPSTDVSREHNDPDDDVARVAAMLYQRILQADVEDSGECFPTALRSALMDRLLPGMGVARLRYEYEASTVTVMDPQTLEMVKTEQVDYEAAPIDYVHWQDYSYGWCRTWSEMPWMAFRSWLTKDEAKKRFGEKKAKGMTYETQQPTGAKGDSDNFTVADEEDNVQKAPIWEIWDKKSKKVFWYNEGCDIVLDALDDPLGLDGFWPAPMPMMANLTTSLYIAQADFITAQDLYNEIDMLQYRITNITRAVKVVGVYDKSEVGSVGRMLTEGVENDMIPVDNWAMFAEKGGLQGVVDWFPVETVVATLQTLIQIRDQTIELLNMVTGMSEIMRGSAGGQYTAAGSNQLAAKMGSIQIQALQEDFARFASDLQALRAEIISKHFAPVSIMRQSSAQFVPEADRARVPAAVELMKSPDIKWRVNIRPESIAMVDYAQLKQERTEFLTAMATYIQSAQAAVQAVPGSLPILLEMLKWGMAGFKGSDYLEGTMDQAIEMARKMPPEGNKDDGKEQQKAQIEQIKQQGELQKIEAKSAADMQSIQAKAQAEQQKQQMDFQQTMQAQQAKAQGDMQKIMADLQADLKVIAAKLQADLTVEKAQSSYSIAERQVEHRDAMIEMGSDHSLQMELIEEQGEQNETREDDDD